jgi:hypothetical protein
VGKTTVAKAIVHSPEVADVFPDGVLWASLGPVPSIEQELHAWARALCAVEADRAETPVELSLRLAGILRNRRMLLVVDDVWDPSHAVLFLIAGRACAMLVTTRLASVSDALAPTPEDSYRLDVLGEDESMDLLTALAPSVVAKHQQACRELVKALEGLPLAIQVAGRLLRAEERHGWGAGDLLAELRDDASKVLGAQAPADMREHDQVSPTVSALLRKSTDRLEPTVRERFAFLAPFAPRPATFEFEDLMDVWNVTDKAEARRVVDILVDRGLLEPCEDGEYQVHQLLVQHARSLKPKRGRRAHDS